MLQLPDPAMDDYLIRSMALRGLDETVRDLGGSTENLLTEANLPTDYLDNLEEFIPYETFVILLNRAAKMLNCTHFGLLLSEKKGTAQLGILSLIVETSPTILEALTTFTRFLHFQTKSATLSLREDGDSIFLVHTIHYKGDEPLQQAYQHAMGIGLNIMNLLGGASLLPTAVYSSFNRAENSSYIRKRYPCPIYHNEEFNGCSFQRSTLQRPLPKSDPVINQLLQQEVRSLIQETDHDFELQLKDIIKHTIAIGDPSIDRVAAYLHKNKRTLQRELDNKGLKFKHILDEVRLETAKHHLKYSALSLTHIADMLGYSDPSAFSRFFSKNTGVSPLKWRNNSN